MQDAYPATTPAVDQGKGLVGTFISPQELAVIPEKSEAAKVPEAKASAGVDWDEIKQAEIQNERDRVQYRAVNHKQYMAREAKTVKDEELELEQVKKKMVMQRKMGLQTKEYADSKADRKFMEQEDTIKRRRIRLKKKEDEEAQEKEEKKKEEVSTAAQQESSEEEASAKAESSEEEGSEKHVSGESSMED